LCRVSPLEVILIESYEPTGPMGVKSMCDVGINAPILTIANVVCAPFTPERVLTALLNGFSLFRVGRADVHLKLCYKEARKP